MIDMNMLIELNDNERIEEEQLESYIIKLSDHETLAIKYHMNFHVIRVEKQKIMDKLRVLKGGIMVERGYKLASNSTELARALIKRVDVLGKLESDILFEKIDDLRKEQENIKLEVQDLIDRAISNGIGKKFDDIKNIIEFWNKAKFDVFTKTGNDFNSAWANLKLEKAEFISIKNYISHLIDKIYCIEQKILELEHHEQVLKQSDHIKSACNIVEASTDDNKVFRELFLMGQYSTNLNNMELQINENRRRYKEKKGGISKSNWARELASLLYLDYWIFGKVPTSSEIGKKYDSLPKSIIQLTISKQMSKHRKTYAQFDDRVLKPSKGRKPKV